MRFTAQRVSRVLLLLLLTTATFSPGCCAPKKPERAPLLVLPALPANRVQRPTVDQLRPLQDKPGRLLLILIRAFDYVDSLETQGLWLDGPNSPKAVK